MYICNLEDIADENSVHTEPGTGEKARFRSRESRKKFREGIQEAKDLVKLIKTQTDEVEQQRRLEIQNKKEEQQTRKLTEKQESDKLNEKINNMWQEEVAKKHENEQLLQAMSTLKLSCNEVLSSKDKLIKEYQQDIKIKEDEYFKSLTKQSDDIDEMLKISRQQWIKLVDVSEQELDAIEKAYNEETNTLRSTFTHELETLSEDRRNKEVYLLPVCCPSMNAENSWN